MDPRPGGKRKALFRIKEALAARGHDAVMTYPAPGTQRALWLLLSLLTVLAAWLAEDGNPRRLALIVLALAWFKGVLLVEYYMGLRHAPRWLHALVQGWLAVVSSALLLSFF